MPGNSATRFLHLGREVALAGVILPLLLIGIMAALPIFEAKPGGFPFLNGTGSFLIKDVALLGSSIVFLAQGLQRGERDATIRF